MKNPSLTKRRATPSEERKEQEQALGGRFNHLDKYQSQKTAQNYLDEKYQSQLYGEQFNKKQEAFTAYNALKHKLEKGNPFNQQTKKPNKGKGGFMWN